MNLDEMRKRGEMVQLIAAALPFAQAQALTMAATQAQKSGLVQTSAGQVTANVNIDQVLATAARIACGQAATALAVLDAQTPPGAGGPPTAFSPGRN